jgi:hypothetical protein
METLARVICKLNPNLSSLGKSSVILKQLTAISIPFFLPNTEFFKIFHYKSFRSHEVKGFFIASSELRTARSYSSK